MTDLIIGGPISRREWIIDRWYEHAHRAAERAGLTPTFLHVVNVHDTPTRDRLDPDSIQVVTEEPKRQDVRTWNHKRYQHMADLRNLGLAAVRERQPRYFLSCDSDILLHPQAIASLIDALDRPALERIRFDAVGGKCFMTNTDEYPSCGMMSRTGGIRRVDTPNGVFPVDVIMGLKLMSPAAYAVDYQFHLHGEDIGWCLAARAAGVKIGWDGRVLSNHVHDRDR